MVAAGQINAQASPLVEQMKRSFEWLVEAEEAPE
jgi:hypothetical protein